MVTAHLGPLGYYLAQLTEMAYPGLLRNREYLGSIIDALGRRFLVYAYHF